MFSRLFSGRTLSHQPALSKDANGRVIVPTFPDLFICENASDRQLDQALEWARQWLSLTEEAGGKEARDLVRTVMSGTASKKETPSRKIAAMACRALSISANRNRMLKSKAAFPWAMLRLGPQVDPCQAALDIDGHLIPTEDFPIVPLNGCDATTCMCWVRGVTKREAASKSG